MDPDDFRRRDDSAELPHQRAIYPQQLLRRDLVRLVQHDPQLLGVGPQRVDLRGTTLSRGRVDGVAAL